MEERIKGTTITNVEGLENLERGTGVQVDNETSYDYAGKFETEGVPVIDPGTGKTISIRAFTFRIDPSKRKDVPIDKQRIFNDHVGFIKSILWGDGLVPLEGVAPRVILNKKKLIYQIFVPCEARLNTTWLEKPENLSVLLAKDNGKLESKNK